MVLSLEPEARKKGLLLWLRSAPTVRDRTAAFETIPSCTASSCFFVSTAAFSNASNSWPKRTADERKGDLRQSREGEGK
jgi:hypothetical protein